MIRPWWMIAACGLGLSACTTPQTPLLKSDGLAVERLPAEVRPDYLVFAERCSKCHALSRALDSGIDDDDFWRRYVDRMRRQPASGISPADEAPILRFLHHYSLGLRRAKAAGKEG